MKQSKIYLLSGLAFVLVSAGIALKNETIGTLDKGQYSYADVKTLDLNKTYMFADEKVPMDNWDALERLERELLVNAYWHSNTLLMIKKSKRYFPIIEQILKEQGLPEDLKYIVAAESSFTNATSPSGAKGLWQMMNATAKDERNHVEKSTYAATKMLGKLKTKFGTWSLAAAAYNMGPAGLQKEMNNQRATDYYELNLSTETLRYVLRLIAIKEVMQSPEKYGFATDDGPLYKPLDKYSEVEVDSTVSNWGDFAKSFGVNYRMLKIYNPWLISNGLQNPSKKKYIIKLPKE
jgi:membrane-bound lytic murein transglycosylase D